MHVGTAQVQGPGNIVEGSHQHPVGMKLTERLTDAGHFSACWLTCIFQRIYLYRILGYHRTVTPYLSQRVKIRTHSDSTFMAQIGYQFPHRAGRTAPAVDAHLSAGTALSPQPLSDGRRAIYLQFHQLVFSTFQLFCCSNKIAGVRPESGRVERDDSRSRRAVKARDKLTPLPMVGDIFALMGVSTWEDTGCEMFAAHQFP